jgi:hypothetical protein
MVGGEENVLLYERSNWWLDETAYSEISQFMLFNKHY